MYIQIPVIQFLNDESFLTYSPFLLMELIHEFLELLVSFVVAILLIKSFWNQNAKIRKEKQNIFKSDKRLLIHVST